MSRSVQLRSAHAAPAPPGGVRARARRESVIRHGPRVGLGLAALAGVLALALGFRRGHARAVHAGQPPPGPRAASTLAPRRIDWGPARTYLKGQTHLHSSGSPDSRTSPVDVARWYRARGFDFIVFTDHNVVTRPPRVPGILTFAGTELTQNVRSCTPAPLPGEKCLAHINALFTAPRPARFRWSRPEDIERVAIYERAIRRGTALGGLIQLNHPNWARTADATLVTELSRRGVALFEIMNAAVDGHDTADAPSLEAMWDAALTAGNTLYAVATDDAHQYEHTGHHRAPAPARTRAARARPGRVWTGDHGFVMVHADRKEAEIRDALARGDFYASSGVYLDRANREGDQLLVRVSDRSPGLHHFRFVGVGGRVLAEFDGREAAFPLAAVVPGGYVRAVVTDALGRTAWVQPVRVP